MFPKREHFDVVLLDIHLKKGKIDGIEALRRLRHMESSRDLPIFALTAYAMKGDHERFEAAGFSGYIAKPFDSAQLRQAIFKMAQGDAASATMRHISV